MRRVCGRKVTRLTLGDLSTCLVLPASQGVGMGRQKSAEAIIAGLTTLVKGRTCRARQGLFSAHPEQMSHEGA